MYTISVRLRLTLWNMVKVPNSKKPTTKGRTLSWDLKGEISKKQKLSGKCFNYGKQGHKSSDCKLPKMNKPKEANVVDGITKDVSDIDLTTVISKVNLVGSNPKELWIDTGATLHVCLDQLRLGKGVHRELCHFRNKGPRKSGLKDDV